MLALIIWSKTCAKNRAPNTMSPATLLHVVVKSIFCPQGRHSYGHVFLSHIANQYRRCLAHYTSQRRWDVDWRSTVVTKLFEYMPPRETNCLRTSRVRLKAACNVHWSRAAVVQSRSPQKKSTIIPCVVVTSIQCCSRRKGRDEYQSGGSKQGQGTEGEGGATGVGREGPHRAESWKGKRSFSLLSATFLYTGLPACRLACTRRANVVRRRRRRITRSSHSRTFTSPSERRCGSGPTGGDRRCGGSRPWSGVACFLCNVTTARARALSFASPSLMVVLRCRPWKKASGGMMRLGFALLSLFHLVCSSRFLIFLHLALVPSVSWRAAPTALAESASIWGSLTTLALGPSPESPLAHWQSRMSRATEHFRPRWP